MRRLGLTIGVAGALALAVTSTIGAAPPLFNATDHPINASLVPEIGINCGTGMPTLITGSYSGVIHTLVQADGTVHINGSVAGTATNDDLPSDGTPDATTTFQSTFGDKFRSNGGESHQFTLNGSGTTTATGATFRFHVLIQTLLDQNGNLKVDILRLTCF
jgi:hypothetical protein